MSDTAPTVFSRIIAGELPGRFVWRDDDVVAFLTIAPINPGHLLVVPVAEVDLWTDVEPATWARMAEVQTALGRALLAAFDQRRVGVIIAGLEVPHCHVHLIPIDDESDLSFARADAHATPEALDAAADRIRSALRADGHDAHVAG
jgi:diadenosine tetraphosphate (Ap4A) HIT family hydrolase